MVTPTQTKNNNNKNSNTSSNSSSNIMMMTMEMNTMRKHTSQLEVVIIRDNNIDNDHTKRIHTKHTLLLSMPL